MNSLPDIISKCKKNINNNKITFRIKLFIIIDIFVRFRTLFINIFYNGINYTKYNNTKQYK